MPAATLKEKKEERVKLVRQAQAYDKEHREHWTAEHETAVNKLLDQADTLASEITADERADASYQTTQNRLAQLAGDLETAGDRIGDDGAALNAFRPDPGSRPRGASNQDGPELPPIEVRSRAFWGGLTDVRNRYRTQQPTSRGVREYYDAFNAFLAGGEASLERLVEKGSLSRSAYNTMQADDAPSGGYLVASEQLAAGVIKDVDDILFIRRYATVHTVRQAKSLGIRKRTAKASTWAWSSELQAPTPDSSLRYGKKILYPRPLSGLIRVSRDLIALSTLSVDQEVRGELSRDGGEVMEDAYLLGDGHNKPLGVFVASSDGISTARDVDESNTTTALTADGLIAAKYALKQSYRDTARWLFHRDTRKAIALLKDGENQYLLRTGLGLRGTDPDTLLGLPVDESERVPNTFTSSQYVGILANWKHYEIADGLDMDIKRLDELYAITNEVGYITRMKTDGLPTLEEAFVRVQLAAS